MKFQIMLAPMEEVTDDAFRTLCYRNGADLTFTEMVRVSNLAKSRKFEIDRIGISNSTPTQIQLAGAKIDDYERFLEGFEAKNGFRGFNLNLGCPSPDFIRQGIGAGMIRRITRVNDIVKLINKYGFECSIKLRLGLNDYEKGKGTYLNLIKNVDASFFAVHAKTAKQKSNDPADFSIYGKCIDTGKLIVANGDIKTKNQVSEMQKLGLFGVMIGRAAVHNPNIFRELRMD
jgi:tRNA-dihydrouridine synthase